MTARPRPGYYRKDGLPHIDASGLIQHIVLRARVGTDLVASGAAEAFERSIFAGGETAPVLLAWCVMPDHAHVACHWHGAALMGDTVRVWKVRTSRTWPMAPEPAFAPKYFDRFCRNRDQADRLWRYVEFNPVDARLVSRPEDWRWSSAWWKAKQGWQPDWNRLPAFPT